MTVAERAGVGRRLGSLLYEALVILALGIFLFLLPLYIYLPYLIYNRVLPH